MMPEPKCDFKFDGCTNDVLWIYSGTGEATCENCKEVIIDNLFEKA